MTMTKENYRTMKDPALKEAFLAAMHGMCDAKGPTMQAACDRLKDVGAAALLRGKEFHTDCIAIIDNHEKKLAEQDGRLPSNVESWRETLKSKLVFA